MTWATEITAKANQITGLNIGLFAPDVLTRGRNTFVEHVRA